MNDDIVSAGAKQSGDIQEEGRESEGKGKHESIIHSVALRCGTWVIEALNLMTLQLREKVEMSGGET